MKIDRIESFFVPPRWLFDLLNFITDPEVLSPVDGYLPILQKPGLGVTVDEAAVRDVHQHRHRWRNPVWRQSDGSFAEW